MNKRRRLLTGSTAKGFYVFKEGSNFQNESKYLTYESGRFSVSDGYIRLQARYGNSYNAPIATIFGDSRLAISGQYVLEGTSCGTGIDFTGYSRLYIDAAASYRTGTVGFRSTFGPYEAFSAAAYSSGIKWVQSQTVTTTRQVFEFDISSISGKRYIQAATSEGKASNQYMYIYNIWLE